MALRTFLPVAVVAVVSGTVPAQAQSEFDSEFDAEFGPEESAPAEPARPSPAPTAEPRIDEFDDEFDEGSAPPTSGEEPPVETPVEAPAASVALRQQRFRAHNTLEGLTGGLRVIDAMPAAVDTFRLQFAAEFFLAGGFLNPGDSHDHLGAHLSFSWALHPQVEVSGSIASFANENDTEDPQLIQVLGDLAAGVKVGVPISPVLSAGGGLRLALLNTVGDIGLVFSSTSVDLRGHLTADLRQLPKSIPLLGRFNLGYALDNSSQLIEDVEDQRYRALTDAAPRRDEVRHLVTRVERFGLQVNRTDFVDLGLGVEVPLTAMKDFYVHPLLEWTWGIPVNRQGYDCPFVPAAAGSDEPAAGQDGCLDREGIGAFPMTLTLGVRILPPVRGLSTFAALDIGLTGTGDFVRELAGNAPYNVLLGLSYAYEPSPPPPAPVVRDVPKRVQVPVPHQPGGRIRGVARAQGTGEPVGDAVVRFPDRELTALVTSADGTFATYRFEPGDVRLELSHPDFHPGSCVATLPEGGEDVELACDLAPLPRIGSLQGVIQGEGGAALTAAEVALQGGQSPKVQSDAEGKFSLSDVPAGTYGLRVTAEGYLLHHAQVEISPRETTELEVQLVPRPRRPLVRVADKSIQIRRQINFATNSSEILRSSFGLMAEIADTLLRHPEMALVEIQGHTDDRGGAQHNLGLSQSRADAVRRWLVEHGVPGDRLEAKGYGMTRPLVPNITRANRAQNRRVQFVIRRKSE